MMRAAVLELELTSDPHWLPELRERVRRWAESQGWSERQSGEIVLALDEAVTNVICHGYGGAPNQRIVVTVAAIADEQQGEGVEIRVRDFGRQVDPAVICGRDLTDVRPGGLGVHIIRAMTNSVEYQRAEGGGMLLTMRKYKTHAVSAGGPATE
jgi:anti-sigma regulatory factor (Ser/Thr protein kinase)